MHHMVNGSFKTKMYAVMNRKLLAASIIESMRA